MSTVLLAADSSWVINDVKAALETPERKVVVSSEPRALADVAGEIRPVVVIIDLQVGSMGGMAMARSLREAQITDDLDPIPTLLLLDRRADAFLAKRAAADAWILKPFDVHELRAVVTQIIETAETAAAE